MTQLILVVSAIFSLYSRPCLAIEISSVRVGGKEVAEVEFQTGTSHASLPQVTVTESDVEFVLPQVELNASFNGKLELSAPHALIGKISAQKAGNGLRIHVSVNGDPDNLKSRVHLVSEGKGIGLRIAPPKKESATLSLLKEEQEPLKVKREAAATETVGAMSYKYLILIGAVLAVAAGATAFLYVTLRRKGVIRGNRKYLIEQLAFCSLGQKSGVSLIKVGREFVLVGVTPQSVTMLSALPALQAQYDEESRFERANFHDAVDEEISRLKREVAL